jgi:hypothetical protein
MHLRPRLNSLEKKIVCMIYPGYQIRGLPVYFEKVLKLNFAKKRDRLHETFR